MSGGSWNYCYLHLNEIAEGLRKGRPSGDPEGLLTPEQREARLRLAPVVEALCEVMRTIEWVDSGDSSEPQDTQAIAEFLAMPQLTEEMKTIGRELATQDNAITAHPIFMVQEMVRVYGVEVGRRRDEDVIYHDGEREVSSVEAREAHQAYVRELHGEGEEPEDFEDWLESECIEEVGYVDHWENRQPFLTRRGAEEYLRINGHNLLEPRIYVESAFRNAEWQLIREALMGTMKGEGRRYTIEEIRSAVADLDLTEVAWNVDEDQRGRLRRTTMDLDDLGRLIVDRLPPES